MKFLDRLSTNLKQNIQRYILSLLLEKGGFTGSQMINPNLLSTYSSLLSLEILDVPNWKDLVDKINFQNFLKSMKNQDGSFKCCLNEESDLRSTYAALVTMKILNI